MPVSPQPRPQRSSAMAVTALVMATVFCLPALPVAGIVLALTALTTGRPGRGMSVAALVIAPLALIPSVLLLTTGAIDDFKDGFESGLRGPEATRDESGEIQVRSQVGVDNLEIGDCVLRMQYVEELEDGEAPLGEVTAVPCDEPHKSEVFEIYGLDPDKFNTQRALDRKAVTGCLPAFKKYVGMTYRRSGLEINFYSPEIARGGVFAQDTVVCLATTRKGLTKTMLAGSKR
jgi:hypothetical protein